MEEGDRQIKQKIVTTQGSSGILLILNHPELLRSGSPEAVPNFSLLILFSKQQNNY